MSTVVLLLATLSTGLSAGVYWLYAHTVMPGLGQLDDEDFVTAFAALDRAILNPWFLVGGFLGAPVLTVVALVLLLGSPAVPWVVAALVLDLATVVITVAVNVPRNNALKASAAAGEVDVAAVRTAFDERRWVRWNLVRVVTSVTAFGSLIWANQTVS